MYEMQEGNKEYDINNSIANRNEALDFIKGCACFCILYMHIGYDFWLSSIISCLSRFAVLIFFMISGYYCFYGDRNIVNLKTQKKLTHIVKLCVISVAIYFIWEGILVKLLLGIEVDILSFVIECFSAENILRFFLYNQLPFGGILWFLFALLYCYLILLAINKFNWYKVAYILVPVLIILHIVSRGYIQYNEIIEENINIDYYRNYLFMGFPFFMLGNFIHKNQDKIAKKLNNKLLIILIVIGMAISCLERLVVALELFWGTVIATFAIFVFAIKNPQKKIIPFITMIGREYSMLIYITHPIVSTLFFYVKKMVGIENNIILAILNPVIIYFLIPIIIYGFKYIKRFLNKEVKSIER